jgi:rare lipoprotein A
MIQKIAKAAGFAALLILAMNAAAPVAAEETTSPQSSTEEISLSREEGMIGRAAYYAKSYEGRRTTSGKRYRHEGMTAAHASLPLGSRVRVVNLANGREIEVTVTDRCRRRPFPFIDLSRGAARKLGFLGRGTANVRIVPLSSIKS